jgi:hypothetical protein
MTKRSKEEAHRGKWTGKFGTLTAGHLETQRVRVNDISAPTNSALDLRLSQHGAESTDRFLVLQGDSILPDLLQLGRCAGKSVNSDVEEVAQETEHGREIYRGLDR